MSRPVALCAVLLTLLHSRPTGGAYNILIVWFKVTGGGWTQACSVSNDFVKLINFSPTVVAVPTLHLGTHPPYNQSQPALANIFTI